MSVTKQGQFHKDMTHEDIRSGEGFTPVQRRHLELWPRLPLNDPDWNQSCVCLALSQNGVADFGETPWPERELRPLEAFKAFVIYTAKSTRPGGFKTNLYAKCVPISTDGIIDTAQPAPVYCLSQRTPLQTRPVFRSVSPGHVLTSPIDGAVVTYQHTSHVDIGLVSKRGWVCLARLKRPGSYQWLENIQEGSLVTAGSPVAVLQDAAAIGVAEFRGKTAVMHVPKAPVFPANHTSALFAVQAGIEKMLSDETEKLSLPQLVRVISCPAEKQHLLFAELVQRTPPQQWCEQHKAAFLRSLGTGELAIRSTVGGNVEWVEDDQPTYSLVAVGGVTHAIPTHVAAAVRRSLPNGSYVEAGTKLANWLPCVTDYSQAETALGPNMSWAAAVYLAEAAQRRSSLLWQNRPVSEIGVAIPHQLVSGTGTLALDTTRAVECQCANYYLSPCFARNSEQYHVFGNASELRVRV